MADGFRIVEVGPRDGLQNEKTLVPAATKIELIERLADCGLRTVEATSFVSPKWVPQLADAAEVYAGIRCRPGVAYPVLVPNETGYERARAVGVEEIAVFGAASEAFSRRNINASIDESIERFRPVLARAAADGVKVRGYVSTVLGCPYQGEVPLDAVADVVARLRDLGCDEIDIADTIGVATPRKVHEVMPRVIREFPIGGLSGHFHDTYGQAVANIYASLEVGISIFHSSVAGLGGCPYAKGATGNVATEDVLYLMQGLGIETGVDLDAVVDAGQFIAGHLGRRAASRVGNAIAAKRAQ